VEWEVEYTDEFGDWWGSLSESEQIDVAAVVDGMKKTYLLPTSFITSILRL